MNLVSHDSAATVIELSVTGFEAEQETAGGTVYYRLSLGSEAAIRQVGSDRGLMEESAGDGRQGEGAHVPD